MSKRDVGRDFAAILLKHAYVGVKKIGEGSFGVAVLAEDKDAARFVCKMVNVSTASRQEAQEARKEARLLAKLKHPYIVRYRESFMDKGWLCIVMDYADGGDLTAKIEEYKAKGELIPEAQVLRWMAQGILALKYLHDKHVLHRDLKPSNLFLTGSGDLRMGDFGISKVLDSTLGCAKTFVGTPFYISPEVIMEKPYRWPADVWSMGCIVFQLCAQKVPFEAQNIRGLVQKVTKGPLPELPAPYSKELREVFNKMLIRNPEERAKVEDIIGTELFQKTVRGILAEKREKPAKTNTKEALESAGDVPSPNDLGSEEKGNARHNILEQFNRFDRNGDGVIDRAELLRVLHGIDQRVWTEDQIDSVLEAADCNNDGLIQLEEFIRWIFGAEGDAGVASVARQMIELALKAAKDGDAEALCDTLLRWRQAVDIGCLRISDPTACLHALDVLLQLASVHAKLLEDAPDVAASHDAARHMGAIIDSVAQLLAERARRHVARAAGVCTKEGAVLGLCFELVDGTRLGQCPGGLSDASLEAAGARWELLRDGEHILEVQGFACGLPLGKGDEQRTGSKSGADKVDDGILAANLVLCTNNGRHIDFGTSKVRGAAFGFKAPGGEQIEDVLFSRLEAGASQVCTGVAHAPLVACWSSDALVTLKGRLKSAAEAVCPVLLRLSWRVGPDHARHALLQARQLGVVVPAALAAKSEESDAGGSDSKLAAPKHWDLALMPGSGPEAWSSSGADGPKTSLPDCDIESLQVMLDTTFVDKGSKGEGQVRVKAPSGMQLVRGLRLQDWQSWAAFSAKREAIREQVRAARGAGDAEAERPRMPTDGCQSPLGAELDAETNGAWLFHLIDSNAVGRATASDFSVVEAGGQDVRSRGRGVYLADNSRAIDELAAGDVGGLRCMLLCQVTLGRSLFDREVMPDVTQLVDKCVSGTYHSVVTDHAKHWAGAYREIVVYDSEQVYPELLLWYRRIYT